MGRLSIFDKIIEHEDSSPNQEEDMFDLAGSPLASNLDKVKDDPFLKFGDNAEEFKLQALPLQNFAHLEENDSIQDDEEVLSDENQEGNSDRPEHGDFNHLEETFYPIQEEDEEEDDEESFDLRHRKNRRDTLKYKFEKQIEP